MSAAKQTIFPYLICKNARAAIDFYKRAFAGREIMRLESPDRTIEPAEIHHAEIQVGDARFMLADEFPDMEILSPSSLGGSGVSITLYVDDTDAATKRASDAGATIIRPPKDEFYGFRSATIRDPFGHSWHLMTEIEQLTPDEVKARFIDQTSTQK